MIKSVLAAALVLAAPAVFAQTCAAPSDVVTGAMTPYNSAGDTCASAVEFNQLCSGGIQVEGRSSVYQLEVGAVNNFVATVTPSGGYDTAIAVIGPNDCSANAPCPGGALNPQDEAGPDGAETLDLPDNLPAGSYYLVITSTAGGGAAPPDCGAYALQITPELPVELQSFSID